MADTTNQRSDLDIQHDLDHLEYDYPPLMSDRFHIKFATNEGNVTITGYVKTVATYDYLLNAVNNVDGVQAVNADGLYVDDNIRRDVGRAIPLGIILQVEYGTVILIDEPNDNNVKIADVVKQVSEVTGVKQVVIS